MVINTIRICVCIFKNKNKILIASEVNVGGRNYIFICTYIGTTYVYQNCYVRKVLYFSVKHFLNFPKSNLLMITS